jgi:hypothetical protein
LRVGEDGARTSLAVEEGASVDGGAEEEEEDAGSGTGGSKEGGPSSVDGVTPIASRSASS